MRPDHAGRTICLKLIDMLNPENEPGRLTLIARMGADKVETSSRRWCARSRAKAARSCGAAIRCTATRSPRRPVTRRGAVDAILREVKGFFAVHEAEGSYAGGVHFEMTGQNVTECIGGASAVTETTLGDRYHTHCDPRLNSNQALELAFLIAEEMKKRRHAAAPKKVAAAGM